MSCLIEIDHLQYRYPDGHFALRNITLHIRHGERVGLVGPNGAGKTTLFNILSGVVDQFQGQVSVAGCDLSTPEGRRQVHCKLGIVFQNTDDQFSIHRCLMILLLTPEFGSGGRGVKTGEHSDGGGRLAPRLCRQGSVSSIRWKAAVTSAGILAMQPQVLLLDEPSSDLDPPDAENGKILDH